MRKDNRKMNQILHFKFRRNLNLLTLIFRTDPLDLSLVQWWEESLVSYFCASLLLPSAWSVVRRRQQEP